MSVHAVPVPLPGGRTARELALVVLGVYAVVLAELQRNPYASAFAVEYGTITALFALRFWAARAVGVAAALAAAAQWLCHTPVDHWPWTAYLPPLAIVLLSSRDLCARYDEASSRTVPNRWSRLPGIEIARRRRAGYGLVLAAAVIGQRAFLTHHASPWPWTLGPVIVLIALAFLLLFDVPGARWLAALVALALALPILPEACGVQPPVAVFGQPRAAAVLAVIGLGAATAPALLLCGNKWRRSSESISARPCPSSPSSRAANPRSSPTRRANG